MFIAEGPGANEDKEGRPFVSMAGKLLDEFLQSVGIDRNQAFITNMVKCRAPDNRNPMPSEMAACKKHLDRQIEIINPALIVPLGGFSMAKFMPSDTISKAAGKLRRVRGRNIYPIIHPAAGLRRQSMKEAMVEHFGFLPEILKTARFLGTSPESEAPEPEPEPPKEPEGKQESLF